VPSGPHQRRNPGLQLSHPIRHIGKLSKSSKQLSPFAVCTRGPTRPGKAARIRNLRTSPVKRELCILSCSQLLFCWTFSLIWLQIKKFRFLGRPLRSLASKVSNNYLIPRHGKAGSAHICSCSTLSLWFGRRRPTEEEKWNRCSCNAQKPDKKGANNSDARLISIEDRLRGNRPIV
jgi:hypothetical protein